MTGTPATHAHTAYERSLQFNPHTSANSVEAVRRAVEPPSFGAMLSWRMPPCTEAPRTSCSVAMLSSKRRGEKGAAPSDFHCALMDTLRELGSTTDQPVLTVMGLAEHWAESLYDC